MLLDDPWEDENATVVPMRRPASDFARHRPVTAKPGIATTGLRVEDAIRLLPRELWTMVIVFCVLFGLGVAVAMSLPKSYTADASLLMQLSQDYVYLPRAGDAARGATSTIDQVVQTEAEILGSTEVKKLVIAKLGYKVILPDSPQLWNPVTAADRARSDYAAMQVLTSGLSIATTPQNGIVRLSFKHANAMSASLILNTLIDEYQDYRLTVHGDTLGPLLRQQKAVSEARLADVDQQYQAFMTQNGVGDFASARTTYSNVFNSVEADLYTTQAMISQDTAKLAQVNATLATLSPEMSTERDLDLSIPTNILALQQQRQDLLARYLPDAQPVKDLDARIASLQALVNSGNGIGEKDHKMGTNPFYQDMLTQKLNLEADLASQTGRHQQLQDQAGQITAKLQGLLQIEDQYNALATERSTLQDNIKSFDQRIQEDDASSAMAKGSDDTMRVVQRASLPQKAQSLKRIVMILAFLFAGATALCAGLLRVYTRKGFANASMASRALDLPVLAQAGVKPDVKAA